MSLLWQLFLLAIVPVSFGMMAAAQFRNAGTRPALAKAWAWTLLLATIWSSGLLLPFVFPTLSPIPITFTWGVISRYALSLLGISLLWTTLIYLETVPQTMIRWLAIFWATWGVMLALDPAIWSYRLPSFAIGSWHVGHFELWAVLWVLSGLLPALLAWLLFWRFYRRLPHSLFRQHVLLGIFALAAFATGMALAYPQLPHQLIWSQIGSVICLFVARIWIPNRISPKGKSLPTDEEVKTAPTATIGHLFTPQTIGQHLLAALQEQLHLDNAHLFLAHLEAGGQLLLRPLASLALPIPTAVTLAPTNPITQQLQQQHEPIIWYDIQKIPSYASISPEEHQLLANLNPTIIQPLHAYSQLVAILLLTPRQNNHPLDQAELLQLQAATTQIAPLLWQSLIQANLYRLTDHAFIENRHLGEINRYQQALICLYQQLISLFTPDLRQPLAEMETEIRQLQNEHPDLPLNHLSRLVAQHKNQLDGIVGATARLEKQAHFHFAAYAADSLIRDAVANLQAMVQGRRIQLTQKIQSPMPPLWGDQQRLTEAVQNVLHNALKFNRIGGQVTIECGVEGGEVAIHISDTGVGIPTDRLNQLRVTFSHTTPAKATSVGGLRLGLLVAHFIIWGHGGRLAVQSEYGVGSRFSLYLPIVL